MSQTLLQMLGDNCNPTTEGGWDEEEDDRKVTATATDLTIKTSFEHHSGNGGTHRMTYEFEIRDGLLVDANDEDSTCPIDAGEEKLQEFVNEAVYFDGSC